MNELDLFIESLGRTDPAERAAFLDQACAGNPELRQRLEELLTGHARGSSPLDRPPVAPDDFGATADLATVGITGEERTAGETESVAHADSNATTDAVPAVPRYRLSAATRGEGIGAVIAGRYTLIELIGEGGMGSVYRADQTEPVKRQLALKLIKTGMDSRGVLARFDAERQALALMDHPNIARIYDGGVTPSGQPFFVMELVKGVPLTEYCDGQRLTVKDRLELFIAVCQAVQHAHQKGIIHRDLKPGNVLVTEVDGRPTPKVIDFGVAKATEVKLTDMSLADVGAIVGTPAYMSPEQADPTSTDIDTRTDIYALGVMLYELLTGSPPIDAKQFQRGAILEMLRMVREVDPPRPSTRLSTAEALPNIASNRSIEPARLAKLLHGELDWVVMKALEKDRSRRYETANGFARDVQRYLANEVVEARSPTRGYRLQKFIKRNKGQVIAASLVFLTLVGGIVGTSLGMAYARKAQKEEAVQRAEAVVQRDKAIASEIKARDEAAKSQAINDFLTQDLLAQAEPANNAVEDKVTLVEVLDRAAEKVGGRFGNQPELELSLRATIANTYHGLASFEKAEAQWQAVLDAARKRDAQSAEAYLAQGMLAHILGHRGRRGSEVLEMAKAAANGLERTLGPDNPNTLGTLDNLASTFWEAGRLPEAIALFERVRDARIAKLGPDHPDTLITLSSIATTYQDVGKLPEAIALFERVRDAQIAKLGPDHPSTLTTLLNLARAYKAAGRFPEAIALFERARDGLIAKLGPDHPDTLTALHNLASAYQDVFKVPEAIALFERVRDAQIAKLGPDHPATLTTLQNLAGAFRSSGRLPEAIALFERVRDAQIAKLGPDHPSTLTTLHNLALAYQSSGRLPEAIVLFESARDAFTAKLGPDHFETLTTLQNLAGAYQAVGKVPEAIALFERVRDAQIAKLGPDHPATLTTLDKLAVAYWWAKQLDKSVPLFEDVLKRKEAKLGRQHPETQGTVANLGVNYKDAGRLKEAIPLLEEAHRAAKSVPPLRWVANPLIDAYMKAGENSTLADLLHEQLAEARNTLPKDSRQLASALAQIGLILLQQKEWAAAEPLLRESLIIREKSQPDHWSTFSIQSALGGNALGQKKYAEAEPMLLAGYEGMKQREATIPQLAKVRLPQALDSLIELFTATNKPDDVKKWQAERAKYPKPN